MGKLRLAVVCGFALGIGILTTTLTTAQEQPQELCRTHERWLEKDSSNGGCGIQGTCYIPAERDAFIPDGGTDTLFVRIKFNVFAEDDGANPASSESEVLIQVQDLNDAYLDAGIQFVPEIEFINDTQYRYWLSSEEFGMKSTYADEPENKLNVYLVAVTEQFSFGTFPWDSDALTFRGGIVMNEFQFGPGRSTLAHEVGHNFGLWHTHHGVSEVAPCSSCYEVAGGADGDTTGDYAIDTDPTPTNFACFPPPGNDPCNGIAWNTGSLDYQNIMGYAPSSCRNFFSLQQQGRKRCWFADVLTGWLAAPPALGFEFPLGRPDFIDPNKATAIQLQVTDDIGVTAQTGQAQGFVSIEGSAFVPLSMTHLGSNLYSVSLPKVGQCGRTASYYFTATSTDLDTFTDPPDAPTELYTALGGFGTRAILEDGFEQDVSAWTVASDASVTSGAWEVADPIGTTTASESAAPGTVSDGDPQNVLVFVTENGDPGGAADDADVDGGPVDLISPVLDLSGSDGLISYNRWFFSDGGDTLTVWVSGDGAAWTLVETVDGTADTWTPASFRVGEFVSPTATVQVRFRTGDSPDDSITEAAIDQFRAVLVRCSPCANAGDCNDVLFCNGGEVCNSGFCEAGGDPCVGLLCDELVDVCVDCFFDQDCDDGTFCNGSESCLANACLSGIDPCPTQPCDDAFDVCIECITNPECDDGVFCNGQEICFAPGVCGAGTPACEGFCNESNDECIGQVLPQQRAGMPLANLTPDQTELYSRGLAAFTTTIDAAGGLGPAYNADSCASCHGNLSPGGSGSAAETLFGFDDGNSFDPLTALGGTQLQANGLSPLCTEVVPPEANLVTVRTTPATYGAGLVEAIDDAAIETNALNPPGSVTGEVHMVPMLEAGGAMRVGRFGWKAQFPTVRTTSVEMAHASMGLTSTLRPTDMPPNGDLALLAQCDAQPDPEDQPDVDGYPMTERVTHFQRYLAPPPQTPQSGMNGELFFNLSGCEDCHVRQFTTPNDPMLEEVLRGRLIRPYSDFLLHDMGSAGDPVEQGTAIGGEVRTAPLWGLRLRDTLWHDGRISGGTVESRILAAILEHEAPGSEASASVQSFLGWPSGLRDNVVTFLASFGRAEFDQNGDNLVDADDYAPFQACFTGPGNFYGPDDECSVSDIDRDGDVDDDDLAVFAFIADGAAGRVPDGDEVAGTQLTLARGAGDQLQLSWGDSCSPGDVDYGIYEGTVGEFASHSSVLCSTSGATTTTIDASGGNRYYLVVPTNGLKEGIPGTDSSGTPRAQGAPYCLPQTADACEP